MHGWGLALTRAMYFISEGTSAIYPRKRRDTYVDRNSLVCWLPNLSTKMMYQVLKRKNVITLLQNLHELSASNYFPPSGALIFHPPSYDLTYQTISSCKHHYN